MILAGEGVKILNLIRNVKRRAANVEGGELVTHSDNKFLIRKYHKEVKKPSNYAKEAGKVIEALRIEVKDIGFEVSIEYANNKSCPNKEFYQQLGHILMK